MIVSNLEKEILQFQCHMQQTLKFCNVARSCVLKHEASLVYQHFNAKEETSNLEILSCSSLHVFIV
jgi:hypothetical protein